MKLYSKNAMPPSNPSFNRGPHFPIMGTVTGFPLVYADKNLGINPRPQIVSKRVLVLHVIITEYGQRLQLVECADDVLKGPVNDGPCIKNFGFGFVQFHVFRFVHVEYPSN